MIGGTFCPMATKKRPQATRSKNKAKKTATKKVSVQAKRSRGRKIAVKKARPAGGKNKRSSASAANEPRSLEPSTLRGATFSAGRQRTGGGSKSRSAGQSGDAQALPRAATVDSESVEELLEEGQTREAAAVSGVETALDPDQSEVRTREVPEDDVPEEYLDED